MYFHMNILQTKLNYLLEYAHSLRISNNQFYLCKKRSFFSIFLFYLCVLTNLQATSLNPLSLKQLYEHSDLIVVAQISQVKQITKGTTVYSSYTLKINEYLKGSGSSYIHFQQLGGKTHKYETIVSAIRQYQTNQTVLLFLNDTKASGWDTLGYAQGSIFLDNLKLQFDNYHYFLSQALLEQLDQTSKEFQLHLGLLESNNLSYLKDLFKLYAS